MSKHFILAAVLLFATGAIAGPSQIEIVGLIPGGSTAEQVEKAKHEYGYVIGGYELACTPEYIDGVLSQLFCITGEKWASRDRTTDSYRLGSNIEIHDVLVKGFTKKFGAPSKIENTPVRNGFGTEFNVNMVVWLDGKGNKLSLFSMLGKVDEGAIIMESAQQLKLDAAKKKETEKGRNF